MQGQQLLSTLESITIPPVGEIDLVAMACGDISNSQEGQRSAYQHALILILRTFLAKRQHQGEENIRCFAQDPQNENVDKEVLSDVRITVLGNPRGFLEVDGSSLIFACYPGAPIRQVVADMARPAVMIWKKVEKYGSQQAKLQFGRGCDSAPRVEAMIRDHYTEFKFPEEKLQFSKDLAIYVRNPDSATQVEYPVIRDFSLDLRSSP